MLRLQDGIRRSGDKINHKRAARIDRKIGVQVKKRDTKRLSRLPKMVKPAPIQPNAVWSMDFVHDWLMTNRKVKCPTVVDDFTKECIGILVNHAIGGEDVGQILGRRGELPERLRSDNGPEFRSNALRAWVETVGVTHDSRFHDECLNEHVIRNLEEARRKIETLRREDYNNLHPHSSL